MNQSTRKRTLAILGLLAVVMAGCASGPASARSDPAGVPTAAPAALESTIASDFTLDRADGEGPFTLSEQLDLGPVVLTIIDTGIG